MIQGNQLTTKLCIRPSFFVKSVTANVLSVREKDAQKLSTSTRTVQANPCAPANSSHSRNYTAYRVKVPKMDANARTKRMPYLLESIPHRITAPRGARLVLILHTRFPCLLIKSTQRIIGASSGHQERLNY